MTCKRQIPAAKSSPDQNQLSTRDRFQDASQPGACQTPSIAIFPYSHAGRSPNVVWLSGEQSSSEAATSIGQMVLKDISSNDEFRPITSLIAGQSFSDRRGKRLGRKSDAGSIPDISRMLDTVQKSNDEQMSAGRRTSAVNQTLRPGKTFDEHRVSNQNLKLSSRPRSYFGWVSNEDEMLKPQLLLNLKQDSNKYQQRDKHQPSDANGKTNQCHISGRFSGANRISNVSQVEHGSIFGNTIGGSDDTNIIDIAPGNDSTKEENIM